MQHTLTVLFRRDPSRDRLENNINFEGYEFFWTDGQPVAVGLEAFCKHGQRLLGLGRHLRGRTECLLELLCFHLPEREVDVTKLPGYRVRRFCLRRSGTEGRVHFLDGTPTAMVFDLKHDEKRVLDWIGLTELPDGQDRWFDIAARPAESAALPAMPYVGNVVPYEASI
jgi:hypothetical protein